jgi:hypothetical protein
LGDGRKGYLVDEYASIDAALAGLEDVSKTLELVREQLETAREGLGRADDSPLHRPSTPP